MTRIAQHMLRLSMFLTAMSFASVALAVATVDVTYTGPQSKINETTIKLFVDDKTDKPVQESGNKDHYVVAAGTYYAEVYVNGKQVGSRRSFALADGSNTISVDSQTGDLHVTLLPPLAINAGPFGVIKPGAFTFSGGGGSVKDKPPTTGVFVDTDTPLLAGPSRITTYNLDANLELLREEPAEGQPTTGWDEFRRTMRFFGCRWNIGGSWNADPSTSTQALPGTHTGWAYWVAAPNGSTGVASTGGANAQFESKFSEVHLNWSVPHLLKEEAPWTWVGLPTLGYQYVQFKYNASIVNASIPGVSSTTDQTAKANNFNAGYGVAAVYTFPNRVWAGAGAGLNAIIYHFWYNGTQDNLCAACAAPTDHYTVSTNDSKNGVTWGATANAIVGFPVAQNAEIFLAGTYNYYGKTPAITSKVSPTDDAPHLSTPSRESANGQLGVRVKF
jgi:hypothetical protein